MESGAKSNEKLILDPRRKFDYTADPNIFYDFLIIGGGVVGLSAAMYAGRLNLKTLVIGKLVGGTITLTDVVENYPGYISIDGPGMGKIFENHAKDYDIDLLNGTVDKIEIYKKDQQRHFKVISKGKAYFAKTICIATGTEIRKLDVSGEKELSGKGVSYCALCDGPLFKGKIIGVVGGSDSAVKEANFLTEFAKKVYIIYRKEKTRGEPPNEKKKEELVKNGKIEIINNTNVIEIKGDKIIKSVILDKPYKGKKEFELGGLFIYIGSTALSDLAKPLKVKLNKLGEIIINKNSETNIKGIYAAGDITDLEWKQAITGVAEGVKAAYYASEYVGLGKYVLPLKFKKK